MLKLKIWVKLDMGVNIVLYKTIITVGGDLVEVRHHTEVENLGEVGHGASYNVVYDLPSCRRRPSGGMAPSYLAEADHHHLFLM